jgi:NAD-dependent deacetylase
MTHLSPETLKKARDVAELIIAAQHVVALTGAGSSTPSDIPDFRSANQGLWTQFSPMEVASLTTFRHNPEKFFKWLQPLARQIWLAKPNSAHRAMARLERRNHIQAIVTQNIDGLHQKAGSNNVIEVHGTLKSLTCIGCYQQYQAEPFLEPYIEFAEIPCCPKCSKILKPDVILFEEQLPAKPWLKAKQTAQNCDLMIVAGSSLIVTPVAKLPVEALENQAKIVVINQTPTYIDDQASIIIHGDVAEVFPAIISEIFDE